MDFDKSSKCMKVLMTAAALLLSLSANAHDFEVDRIFTTSPREPQ